MSKIYGDPGDEDEEVSKGGEFDIEAEIGREVEGMKTASKESPFQPVRIDVQCGTVDSPLGSHDHDHVLTLSSFVLQGQSTDRSYIIRAKNLLRCFYICRKQEDSVRAKINTNDEDG